MELINGLATITEDNSIEHSKERDDLIRRLKSYVKNRELYKTSTRPQLSSKSHFDIYDETTIAGYVVKLRLMEEINEYKTEREQNGE